MVCYLYWVQHTLITTSWYLDIWRNTTAVFMSLLLMTLDPVSSGGNVRNYLIHEYTKICKYFKKNWTSMNIKILNIVEETKLLPRQVLTRAIERDLCKNRTKINHNKICSLWCIGKFPKHNIQSRTFIYFSDKHLASPYVLCLGEHGTCRLGNIFLQAHFISSIKHISIDFYVLFCSVPLPFE